MSVDSSAEMRTCGWSNLLRNVWLLLFFLAVVHSQMDIDDDEEIEDPLSIGGGTQQTCDACRTVMDQLLQEWHTFDNDAFLEAIDEAAHRNEYVPVVPEDEVAFRYNIESIERTKGIREESHRQVGTNSIIVILRFMKRCKNVDIWIQYT